MCQRRGERDAERERWGTQFLIFSSVWKKNCIVSHFAYTQLCADALFVIINSNSEVTTAIMVGLQNRVPSPVGESSEPVEVAGMGGESAWGSTPVGWCCLPRDFRMHRCSFMQWLWRTMKTSPCSVLCFQNDPQHDVLSKSALPVDFIQWFSMQLVVPNPIAKLIFSVTFEREKWSF